MSRLVIPAALLAAAALAVPVRRAVGQLCVGTTALLVRDAAGRVMTDEQMPRDILRTVNGVPVYWRRDTIPHFPPYFAADLYSYSQRDTVPTRIVVATNPLKFNMDSRIAFCGQVSELTLSLGGTEMRLFLDVYRHNTYYEIESPPFQAGTFRLGSLRCETAARPPMIDNRTKGKCRVSAENWQGRNSRWARSLIPFRSEGGFANSSDDRCRHGGLHVIANQTDWEAAWNANPGIARGNPLPRPDFRYRFMLVVYLPDGSASYSHESLRVDNRGDLTFVPVRGGTDPGKCSILFLELSRRDVQSIRGMPLPPAPVSR